MCAETDTLVYEKVAHARAGDIAAMWTAGETAKNIGGKLGIPTTEVYEVIHDMRLPNRKGAWTIENQTALRTMRAAGRSCTAIGVLLGFSKSAVCGEMSRLKLPQQPRNQVGNAHVDSDTVEHVKRLRATGLSLLNISAAVGIDRHRVGRVIGPDDKLIRRRATKPARVVKEFRRPVPADLRTLEETDSIWDSYNEATRYLRRKRLALVPLPAPKNPRQCSAVDGPRYRQVQCAGLVDDLRSSYCADCRTRFHVPRAAA